MMACPTCGHRFASPVLEICESGVPGNRPFNAVAFLCPVVTCRAVLSVQIDPWGIKTETVAEVAGLMKAAGMNALAIDRYMKG